MDVLNLSGLESYCMASVSSMQSYKKEENTVPWDGIFLMNLMKVILEYASDN